MEETQHIEKKSIRIITGTNPDWKSLAKDCVCFANARGGVIFIGIEDDEALPPTDQKINSELPARIRKRMAESTVNVATHAELVKAVNGGEYIEL